MKISKINIRPIVERTLDIESLTFRDTTKRDKQGTRLTQDINTGKKYKTMSIMFEPTFCGDDGLNMYDAMIVDQQDNSILVGVAEEDLKILEQLSEWINTGKLDFFCFPQEPVATVATPTNESNSN